MIHSIPIRADSGENTQSYTAGYGTDETWHRRGGSEDERGRCAPSARRPPFSRLRHERAFEPFAIGSTGHDRFSAPPNEPFIASDSQQHRDLAKCHRLGVEAHLIKPVDFSRFTTVTPRLNLQWALLKSG